MKAIRDPDGNVIGRLDLFDFIEDAVRTGDLVLTLGVEWDGETGEVTGYDLVPMPVVANHG